jgi:hypothetical protein
MRKVCHKKTNLPQKHGKPSTKRQHAFRKYAASTSTKHMGLFLCQGGSIFGVFGRFVCHLDNQIK